MEKIDLSTNSRKVQEAYDKVVRGDPSVSYVVYSVDNKSTLDVLETGNGSLDEFVENFSEGQIQFGLARVTVPGSDVSKNLLLGWCPDNSPAKSRLSFASNFAEVSKVLSGYHVQITARDLDDLDVDDFLHRIGAAAGARYSIQSGSSKPVATPQAKPIVAKQTNPKPAAKPFGTSSFVPKSTGKPVAPVTPKPSNFSKPAPKSQDADEWGGQDEIKERDFSENPIKDLPSAYKPTKVNIAELRKQKSDTISSQPKPFKAEESSSKEDASAPSLSERIGAFKHNESDGRMTSLPKPKVNHSVSSRFSPASSSSAPSFGSKPQFGASNDFKKDKIVGGLSRNFGAEGGKTPAQIWAEKRGQYKSVSPEVEDHKVSDLAKNFSSSANLDDKEEEEEEEDEEEVHVEVPAIIKPSSGGFPAPPKRNLPPVQKEEEEEEEEKEEEEEVHTEEPAIIKPSLGGFPAPPKRNLPPIQNKEEEEEKVPTPSLPVRNLPPAPKAEPEPESEEETEPAKPSISAVAAYDYEKDEDNEIGFSEGDFIVEIDFVDEEWWSGTHSKTGEVGLFPAAYVELEKEEKTAEPVVSKSESPVVASSAPDKKATQTATAEYDYEKDEDNEIAFSEGDLITEIEFVDEDWWSGKHSKTGESGLFPANYVKLNE
jgi:hypothetical protein